MKSVVRGLYQDLVTEALADRLREIEGQLKVRTTHLHHAEAADRIALHLCRLIEIAIAALDDQTRVEAGITLARRLIDLLTASSSAAGLASEKPLPTGQELRAVLATRPDGSAEELSEPLIPLLDTALLTNAPGEPRVGAQLATEIPSADRIDVLMAFIRKSGIDPILEALRKRCAAGCPLRILTTTYTGSTEARALSLLVGLGAEVRISYDVGATRLHAKAWLFHRNSGFSTAYIGSSNLTHSAQVSGLEWNARFSSARNRTVIDKVRAVFESYWNSGDFVPYDETEFRQRAKADRSDGKFMLELSPLEVRLDPFQDRLLEQIELSRQLGRHRNLLVSATGTGKTVMAAVDYGRLVGKLPRARLLFVAHRAEILEQSRRTFRHVLRDGSFGELWVGGQRPNQFEHVFASIQSLNASGLQDLPPDHFDVVIVDEFHHAAATSYRRLLERVQPVELLGLTATPERSDGLPVLEWFDGKIAAELRLWDAIDQQRLVPFAYYGIHDGVDLREIPWRRNRGYDIEGLTRVYTSTEAWARLVLKELDRRVGDLSQMRALGFCVSVEHARFMARIFNSAGIPSIAIWSDTPDEERRAGLEALSARRVNVVFSVDLFNEGVDVPAIDTLLMLRPTDSPTLFLQQLGRGLRRHEGKTWCTVLDFVGRHRQEFRFDRRLRALFGITRKRLIEQVEMNFPYLPAGCHMELDRVAQEIVLGSIRRAVPDRWPNKVEELRRLSSDGAKISLAGYLDACGMDLADIYTGGRSWSDLCEAAGLGLGPQGPFEAKLRRACGRLLHIDDLPRIHAYQYLLALESPPDHTVLPLRHRRFLRMLVASLVDQVAKRDSSLTDGCTWLWQHPQVRSELRELFDVLAGRISHVAMALESAPDLPLSIHARYTRVEILAAFDVGEGATTPPWQAGVLWARQTKADLLAFTLDKTSGSFSPTTRYRDYAISRQLIHWESQSTTRADSPTGRRYQEHVRNGSSIMLFARERTDDRAFYFLGPAIYVRHESETPMAITWQLEHSLPGDLYAAFAAAVA